MARKGSSTILQEELYPSAGEAVRGAPDDALDDGRLLDLDVEPEPPFLRAQKRISVRRGSLPRRTATRLTWTVLTAAGVLLCGMAIAALYHYGERSWRFRVESSDDIEMTGLGNVTRAQVMEVMGGDIGRNIFFVPLAQRQKQLQQIPWVESASVMRFVPNRVKIEIQERTPVAFARVGSKIFLVDAAGTLMDLPVSGKKKYSFPVILGMNLGEPYSTRAARMKIYNDVTSQLDSGGAHYSQDLSEVDLSDPDDVKVLADSPEGEVLVHLGSSNYLERYEIYVAHVQEWRQQFNKLESVDLRYDRQIVVNPDLQGTAKQPPLSFATAKAAVAAGMKPAALISHQVTALKPQTAISPATGALPPAVAARKKGFRARHRKVAAKVQAKPRPAPANKSVAQAVPPAAQARAAKTSPPVSPATGTIAVKPGNKPSPAIAKGEEHP